jgi:hypothetical protein
MKKINKDAIIKKLYADCKKAEEKAENNLIQASIYFGVKSIIELDRTGNSENNKLIPYKKQCESAFMSAIKYYFQKHDKYECVVLNSRIDLDHDEKYQLQDAKMMYGEETHDQTHYIKCDLILSINKKKINFELDGKQYHNNYVDMLKDHIANSREIEVVRIGADKSSIEELLSRKLMSTIAGVKEILNNSSEEFGTIRI